MPAKPQILFIHGGMTFKNKKDYLKYLKKRDISIEPKIRWGNEWLEKQLGKKFQIIRPEMPLKHNSKYEEWKIHFERHFPLLKNNITLIGTSLGGVFLAKYLSENKFPKKIRAAILIGAPYDNSIPGEDLVGGFRLGKNLSKAEKQVTNLFLLFSEYDDVVPPVHAEKYRKKLPNAEIIIYDHIKGHFQLEKFPEIVKIIKTVWSK